MNCSLGVQIWRKEAQKNVQQILCDTANKSCHGSLVVEIIDSVAPRPPRCLQVGKLMGQTFVGLEWTSSIHLAIGKR